MRCTFSKVLLNMVKRRRTRLTFTICIMSMLTCFSLIVYKYFYYVDLENLKSLSGLVDAEVPPMLPDLDPFAPEFRDFLEFSGDPVVKCNGGQIRAEPWVKVVDGNKIVFSVPKGVIGDVKCEVRELKMWPAMNNKTVTTKPGFWGVKKMKKHTGQGKINNLPAQLFLKKSDFASAKCIAADEDNHVTDEWEGFISGIHVAEKFRKNQKKKNANAEQQPANVLIFIIDAVSRFTAENAMPKTMKYLRNELGAAIFEHHTIVGENSLPNAVALLTGRKLNDLPAWVKHGALLDYPMIWKEFSKRGYATAYMEDWTQTFRDDLQMYSGSPPPTDHSAVMFGHYVKKFRSGNCIRKQPAHELYVGLPEAMWSAYPQTQPKFFMTWFNQYSHSDVNCAAYLDAPLTEMLQSMHEKGYLDNTLTMIMGDHGNRYMKWFRGTDAGRYDHRTPFLAVVPPLGKKPVQKATSTELAWHNVWKNVDKLTSHLDLHATLMEVLGVPNQNQVPTRKRLEYAGRSLLTPISPTRTCKDAGISAFYCPYIDWSSNALPWGIANSLGNEFVEFLNEYKRQYFARHGILDGPCIETTLKRTQNAGVLEPGRFYLVLFVNSDIFEGMEFEVSGGYQGHFDNVTFLMRDVARLDKFGDPPKCLKDLPEEAEKKTIEFLCECRSGSQVVAPFNFGLKTFSVLVLHLLFLQALTTKSTIG